MTNASITAVLLAGGRSTRMGRDKSGVRVGGIALWERQLATLRALAPAELAISGGADGPYRGAGIPIWSDDEAGLGPLGGITTALRRMAGSHLLVLAVDLPMMPTGFLFTLMATASLVRGVVPSNGEIAEPLAALYPREAHRIAMEQLAARERSMQRFVARCIAADLVVERQILPQEREHFLNINRPEDIPGVALADGET